MVFNAEVDAIGMNCPLPILRTKKALANMQSGEVLKIKATDAGAVHDLSLIHISEPCLLYTSPSPRDRQKSRMPSSA